MFNGLSQSSGGLLDVDPGRQWEWHEAHRDMAKNMYRTSYTDMIHFKETSLKSDYPSGYGGHIPNVRFDQLFRNEAFDRNLVLRRNDPSRDAHPSFKDQIAGVPTICAKPQGAKKNPTFKVVPHDGTTGTPLAPWGVVTAVRPVPTFRNVPITLKRARSSPTIVNNLKRGNSSAQFAGAAVVATPGQSPPASPANQSPSVNFVGSAVSQANQEAQQGAWPSEHEMLMEEMNY